jgi:hypothetical protein
MVVSRVRPKRAVRVPPLVAAAVLVGVVLADGGEARAGKNDLELLSLCPRTSGECDWVQRNGAGAVTGVDVKAPYQEQFRSLMSELGVVVAPRLQTPADTLGYSGFQFSFEMGFTKVNSAQPYWNAVSGTPATGSTPASHRPDTYLTTIGGFVRKGIWLPLPAFEVGAGAVHVMSSNMYAVQGYAKLALQEGFHGWWLPSVAVRGAASQLLGTEQVDLTVYGVDVLISKAFGLGGMFRLEPFAGWNLLFIDAASGALDATPGCDAFAASQSPGGTAKCGPTSMDANAFFAFPQQDVITRQRLSGGFKLKWAVLFVVAQYDLIPAGRSHNSRAGAAPVRDTSQQQQSFSLSAGLDF